MLVVLYIVADFANVVRKHDVNIHMFADDISSVSADSSNASQTSTTGCLPTEDNSSGCEVLHFDGFSSIRGVLSETIASTVHLSVTINHAYTSCMK